MIYSNPEFLILFFSTFVLYVLSPRYWLRFGILCISSLLFYSWAGIFDSLIFLFVVVISWLATFAAKKIPARKSAFLFSGICLMALHLFFWKYASWISGETQKVFPGFLGGRKVCLPLPVGISFFTLQGIAYLVDYKRDEKVFLNFPRYLLFKSFFSQLVAGPIVRVHDLQPQLRILKRPSWADVSFGAGLFIMGFVKKLLLADRIAPFVDQVFADPGKYGRITLFNALLGYTIQIYADFSGYTDMGRGTARMLGIRLPENFLSPYLSKAPSEFWRRWHITLSQWIRDYIYIPLGGNKGSLSRVILVALFTMMISGLWHGANWTFVLWGIYHGILLIFERIAKILFSARNDLSSESFGWAQQLLQILKTFCMFMVVMLGWLIFRAKDFSSLVTFIRAFAIGAGGDTLTRGTASVYSGFILMFFIQFVLYFDLKRNRFSFLDYLENLTLGLRTRIGFSSKKWNSICLVAYLSAGLFCAAISLFAIMFRPYAENRAFIYFQF